MSPRSSFASLRRGAFSVILLGLAAAPASAQWPYLMSRTPSGSTATGMSASPSVSGDGRFVAFGSVASDLVADDTNGRADVFVHDRVNHTTVRVSVDSYGRQANQSGGSAKISANGRWVSFFSYANNLVPNDTNGKEDIFVHDLHTGETTRVSVDSSGVEANGSSRNSAISGDGSRVVFTSDASNLVPGDENSTLDVFLHDRATGTTVRVSLDEAGNELPTYSGCLDISANGLWVSFMAGEGYDDSDGTDSWQRYARYEVATGIVTYFFNAYEKHVGTSISEDGTTIWGTAKHHAPDHYWHVAKITESDIDLVTVGLGANGHSSRPVVSGDGSQVVFRSEASNLVGDDTNSEEDVFSLGIHTMKVHRVSQRVIQGTVHEADDHSGYGWMAISEDGRYAAFSSYATNLTDADTNGTYDVFLGMTGGGQKLDLWYDPPFLYPEEQFQVVIEGGEPRTLGLQFILSINGVPFTRLVKTGRFNSEARWVRRGTVPRGLSGLTLTFASFALGPFGKVLMSPRQDVEFR